MKPGRPKSVGRPKKEQQPQEEPDLDDLNNVEANALDEEPFAKIKPGARWSGLVDLDMMRGKLVAPLPIA